MVYNYLHKESSPCYLVGRDPPETVTFPVVPEGDTGRLSNLGQSLNVFSTQLDVRRFGVTMSRWRVFRVSSGPEGPRTLSFIIIHSEIRLRLVSVVRSNICLRSLYLKSREGPNPTLNPGIRSEGPILLFRVFRPRGLYSRHKEKSSKIIRVCLRDQ